MASESWRYILGSTSKESSKLKRVLFINNTHYNNRLLSEECLCDLHKEVSSGLQLASGQIFLVHYFEYSALADFDSMTSVEMGK